MPFEAGDIVRFNGPVAEKEYVIIGYDPDDRVYLMKMVKDDNEAIIAMNNLQSDLEVSHNQLVTLFKEVRKVNVERICNSRG